MINAFANSDLPSLLISLFREPHQNCRHPPNSSNSTYLMLTISIDFLTHAIKASCASLLYAVTNNSLDSFGIIYRWWAESINLADK